MSLTPRMLQTLAFIEAEIARTGSPPTFEEMKEHLGLSSKSAVFRLVDSLEERGYILRLRGRARAIDVLRSARPSSDYLRGYHAGYNDAIASRGEQP